MSEHRRPVPPPRESWQRLARVEPVPETEFGLAIMASPPAISGPAVGSLVAGVAAVAASFLVTCFGLAGAGTGWGAPVAGAFAVLAGGLGAAAVGLAIAGLRQTRTGGRPEPGSATGARTAPAAAVSGRGLAVSGLICGASGFVITLTAFAVALAIQLGGGSGPAG